MKQKFLIQRSDKDSQLNIKEYANLGREYKYAWQIPATETFSLIGEETYANMVVISAIEKGEKHLISALRTRNMYPIGSYAEKIADTVISLYESNNKRSVELLFDDKKFFVDEEEDSKS